jgi:hypothetical protein
MSYLSVWVQFHVKCFNVFGIINQDNRLLVHLLRDVSLVLRRQVNTPVWLYLKFAGFCVFRGGEECDGVRVTQNLEWLCYHIVQTCNEALQGG